MKAKPSVELKCGVCQRLYYRKPASARKSKWCSKRCQAIGKNKLRRRRVSMVCETCGKTFEVIPALINKRKHCSRACYKHVEPNTTCQQCGKQFHVMPYRKAKFCSLQCSGMSKRVSVKARERKKQPFNCVVCGKEFMRTWYGSQPKPQYCNQRCFGAKKKKQTLCCCKQCGKEFWIQTCRIVNGGQGKYCSRKCQQTGSRGWHPWRKQPPGWKRVWELHPDGGWLERKPANVGRATKEQIAEWDKVLDAEGLGMDRGRLYEKRTIQFEEYEDPGLRIERRRAAGGQ